MPYESVDDIPQAVKDRIKSPKKRRQWLHVWNSSYEQSKDEGRAFAAANATVKKAIGPMTMESDLVKAGNGDAFSFFLPISKVDKERRTVSGYASTECLDLDGEIVSRDAVKAALPGYWQWRNIREMHQPSAVGKAQEASMDEKGLYLTAKIVDESAWKKVEEGVYNGFSIGGRKLAKTGNTVTKVDLVEISVVDRPANPECRFTVQKSATVDGENLPEAVLLPASPGEEPPESIEKGETEGGAEETTPSAPVKKMKKAAKAMKGSVSSPSVSIPDAGGGGAEATVGDGVGSSHEPKAQGGGDPVARTDGGLSKRERKLLKRMGVAGSLSYCFDQLREAQRGLMREAQVEGGDRRDVALAQRLGEVARSLAAVIGQKAEHEGQGLLAFTDADDQSFQSIYGEGTLAMSEDVRGQPDALSKMIFDAISKAAKSPTAADQSPIGLLKAARGAMKQAKEMRQEAEECVKALFDMHKAAYGRQQALVKAGKVKDDEKEMDHADAMKMLQKAFGALANQKTFAKAASDGLKKAAGRISGEGTVEDGVPGIYEVPSGVKTKSPSEVAKAGMVSKAEAEAMAKAAALEAENKLLKSMPAAGGAKPYAFDVSKMIASSSQGDALSEFFKGANPADLASADQSTREAAISKSIGERILGGAGKSLFDPAFHGTAGAS